MLISVFPAPVDVLAVNAQADGTGSVIFINGDTGSDEAEEKTNAEPVKTVSRAKAMLDGEKGTVMVTGTVIFEVTQNWELGGATIKRNTGSDGGLVNVKAAEADDCLGAQTTVKLTVAPKKTVLSGAVSKKRGQISVKWKKDSKATGYQVSVSRDKSFKKGTVTKNVKGSSKTFTKLKKGKKYYVKVRSYKTSEGKKIYGNYSRVKTVKVK